MAPQGRGARGCPWGGGSAHGEGTPALRPSAAQTGTGAQRCLSEAPACAPKKALRLAPLAPVPAYLRPLRKHGLGHRGPGHRLPPRPTPRPQGLPEVAAEPGAEGAQCRRSKHPASLHAAWCRVLPAHRGVAVSEGLQCKLRATPAVGAPEAGCGVGWPPPLTRPSWAGRRQTAPDVRSGQTAAHSDGPRCVQDREQGPEASPGPSLPGQRREGPKG